MGKDPSFPRLLLHTFVHCIDDLGRNLRMLQTPIVSKYFRNLPYQWDIDKWWNAFLAEVKQCIPPVALKGKVGFQTSLHGKGFLLLSSLRLQKSSNYLLATCNSFVIKPELRRICCNEEQKPYETPVSEQSLSARQSFHGRYDISAIQCRARLQWRWEMILSLIPRLWQRERRVSIKFPPLKLWLGWPWIFSA